MTREHKCSVCNVVTPNTFNLCDPCALDIHEKLRKEQGLPPKADALTHDRVATILGPLPRD